MSKRMRTQKNPVPPPPFPKVHEWRICPLGQHWVSEHPRTIKPSKKHPVGYITSVAGHCRTNSSHKDQLYSDEIHEIALQKFTHLRGKPKPDDLGYGTKGNEYDRLIRGWTRYWNEVLKPNPPKDIWHP